VFLLARAFVGIFAGQVSGFVVGATASGRAIGVRTLTPTYRTLNDLGIGGVDYLPEPAQVVKNAINDSG
jgi:hypothetical protein